MANSNGLNTNKSILILIVIIIAAILVFYGLNFYNNPPVVSPTPTPVLTGSPQATSTPQTQTIQGNISAVDSAAKNITILSTSGSASLISVLSQTKISDKSGNAVDFSYLRKGFTVEADVLITGSVSSATNIKILQEPNIIVFSPKPNDEISLPLVIDGEARVFESAFNYRLKDSNGAILVEKNAMANAPDAGQYGPFHVEVNYPAPLGTAGTLEVFDYSAKDGSEIDKVTIPVRFGKVDSQTIKVFFGNTKLNPGAADCQKVFSVNRRIPKTQAVARAALEELLVGVTAGEASQSYFTGINTGVKINSITIASGVAKADFDETLELAVGGSCRVAEIRAEITQTLKQFSTVKSVIISINGRTEDILQP